MSMERPDLSQVDSVVVAYIEWLETQLDQLQQAGTGSRPTAESSLEPAEPLTTLNLITLSRSGVAKRTPRHLYNRQRRGGMGIFDLETGADDPPIALTIADQNDDLLLITNRARAFRLPLRYLPDSIVRARGEQLADHLSLAPDETVSLMLPHRLSGYLTIITKTAQLRRLRHHFFGENMIPGNLIYDTHSLGAPVAACWSDGTADIIIATRRGKAVRFPEASIPFRGCLAVRLNDDDEIVGVAAVKEATGLFLLTADGRGTIRLMTGFSANKTPGAGGKVAIKSDRVVGIVPVSESDDLFIISRLSKLIRFKADEIPAKDGVVQGVNCMALRGDETVAVVAGGPVTS